MAPGGRRECAYISGFLDDLARGRQPAGGDSEYLISLAHTTICGAGVKSSPAFCQGCSMTEVIAVSGARAGEAGDLEFVRALQLFIGPNADSYLQHFMRALAGIGMSLAGTATASEFRARMIGGSASDASIASPRSAAAIPVCDSGQTRQLVGDVVGQYGGRKGAQLLQRAAPGRAGGSVRRKRERAILRGKLRRGVPALRDRFHHSTLADDAGTNSSPAADVGCETIGRPVSARRSESCHPPVNLGGRFSRKAVTPSR